MIHADKKSASKWRDMPIPFPADEEDGDEPVDLSGVSQIPLNLRGLVHTEK